MTLQRHLLPALLAVITPVLNAADQPGRGEGAPASAKPAHPPAPGDTAGKEHRHGGHEGRGESGMSLGRLLEMDDARLARMRGLIERVEKLPAEERLALRKRLQAAAEASPADREALMRELHQKLGLPEPEKAKGAEPKGGEGKVGQGKSPEGKGGPGKTERGAGANQRPIRDLLEKHFTSLPPEQAKAEKEKFLAMSRDDKVAYIKQLREKYGLPAPAEPAPSGGDMMMRVPSRPAAPDAAPKAPDRDDPFRPAK